MNDHDAGAATERALEVPDALARQGRSFPIPDVPAELHDRLIGLFDGNESAIDRELLRLVADTRTDRPLAGLRGVGLVDDYTLTFRGDEVDVVVDVSVRRDGASHRYAVRGLVLPLVPDLGPFEIALIGPCDVAVQSDRLGRFDLALVSAGRYRLTVTDERVGAAMSFALGSNP